LAGQLSEIIDELERRRMMIDQALAALRDVDGIGSPVSESARRAIAQPVGAVRKGNDNKQPGTSRRNHSTVEKVGVAPPTANGWVSGPGKTIRHEVPATRERRVRKLTEGTMKARTVELLRKVGKPMHSGEVAKRMKIGSGYASVNLSQLRRDGFLNHTAAGYILK
jgi:hypothetical protein